jgi:transposase
VQNTNSQYNLPAIGKKIAYKANREGVAERFADPAVQKSIAVDLALITSDDALLRDVELTIVKTARHHDANTLHLLQTVPGIGKILSLVLLYEIHDVHRFPRVQDCVSYCRLVKCARESAGKRYGTSGTKIGNAHLKWAFSEAAVLFLRDHPAAQQYLTRLELYFPVKRVVFMPPRACHSVPLCPGAVCGGQARLSASARWGRAFCGVAPAAPRSLHNPLRPGAAAACLTSALGPDPRSP